MTHSEYTGEEYRRFVRIPFWFITKYRDFSNGTDLLGEFGQGTGKNISIGGICFEAKDKFEIGNMLEIDIDMPSLEYAIRVVGKVVWCNIQPEGHYLYGFSFVKIKNEDVHTMRKIIETFE